MIENTAEAAIEFAEGEVAELNASVVAIWVQGAASDVATEACDLVRIDIGRRYLDGRRQVQDFLFVGVAFIDMKERSEMTFLLIAAHA